MNELERLLAATGAHPQAKENLRRYIKERASPVDYDARNRGYMLPPEPTLIHALTHGGARVSCMSSLGPVTTWLVVQTKDGKHMTTESIRALSKHWRALLEIDLEILEEPSVSSDPTRPPVESATAATPPAEPLTRPTAREAL